jgi:hypothetical protein
VLILCFIEVKVGKLKNTTKLRKKLRGNRGSLRSHWGNLRNCIIFEEMVIGEQGLAALALGKFEEEYEI